MTLPPLSSAPGPYRDWITGAIQLLYAGLQTLDTRLETVMAELGNLSTQVAQLKTAQAEIASDVDRQIQQLAEVQAALEALGNQPTQAEIDALAADVQQVRERLQASSLALKSDDPAVPPTP